MKLTLLGIVLASLIFLLGASLFKNISFPLLWNDESETAMMAEHVLDYGYPKVHDEKNKVYHFSTPIGLNKEYDANLNCSWAQYYFASFGASLARMTNSIYTKTAIMRIPFATIGLVGLFIFALTILPLFKNVFNRLLFLTFFFLFEIFSVPLALHLREVRYYSLTVFLISLIFLVYLNHVFYKKLSFKPYFFSIIILLFLLFNTFYPAFIIFIFSIGLHQVTLLISAVRKKQNKLKPVIISFLKQVSPLIVSFAIVLPLIYFFRIFEIAQIQYQHPQPLLQLYLQHLNTIILFFIRYDFLYLGLLNKIFLISLLIHFKKNNISLLSDNKIKISNFLTFFFVIYIVIIARSSYFFERYYITLQPIFILILLIDGFCIFKMLGLLNKKSPSNRFRQIVPLSIGMVLILSLINIYPVFKNHLYELTHQYKGPLDYTIPYIKKNYKNPKNLVIATNYEETSYMYYLGSKTIIGFVFNNLEKDIKEKPDILIYRKGWPQHTKLFNIFLQRDKYKRISFPVFDYPFNTIPEMSLHLFRTEMATNETERADIFVKIPDSK